MQDFASKELGAGHQAEDDERSESQLKFAVEDPEAHVGPVL